MNSYTCAVVAAGSQGRVHAQGYLAAPGARLTAVADPDVRAAAELARDLGIPGIYRGYAELLAAERPDVLSVCTPPGVRAEVVRAAIVAGVKAIHCEKPIATSYGDVLQMRRLASAAGVQLTVNLQRRFEPVNRFARDQIAAGAIGDVISLEGYCPNLPDWGAHIVDLLLFYRGDRPASWVTGQVDVSVNRYVYGAFAETSSLTQIAWDDGVHAVIATGREPQTPVLNLANNLGVIVQGTRGRLCSGGARCVIQRFGQQDETFESPFYRGEPSPRTPAATRDTATWDRGVDPAIVACTAQAIEDLLASLADGRDPVLRFDTGARGAEIIFATYESSRSRRRVWLPLDVADNALLSGLAQGFWQPAGEQHSTY